MLNLFSYIIHEAPFFWLFLLVSACMLFFAVKAKNVKVKILIANLLVFPLVISMAEFTCSILNYPQTKSSENITYTPQIPHTKDKFLGYSLYPNMNLHAIARQNKKIIYDVNYKIDKNGLRYTPSSNENSNQCVMFFGCSFTFGEGLNDNETLPNQFGEKTHNKYKIYNFAYLGYGAHQMLSAIEHGVVDKKISGCKNTIIIYDGMPDHVLRLARKHFWNINDPKYELINNEAVYKESSSNNKIKRPEIIKEIKRKSQIYIYIDRWIINKNLEIDESEKSKYVKLYIAVLKKSKELAIQKYNTHRFIILFWDFGEQYNLTHYDFPKKFRDNSLEFYMISDVLHGYSSKYFIKNEIHPNKLANEKIAEFLAKKLASDSD